MNKTDYKNMWVFIEKNEDGILPVSLELLCEVRRLCDLSGDKLVAVAVSEITDAERELIADCGTDILLRVSGTGYESFSVDAYTELFTRLCKKHKPSAVFVGGTVNGRDFAPRFACRLPTGCTSDATELIYDEKTGDIEFVEPAVGGKLMAVITVPFARPQVGTIRPGTFKYAPTGKRELTELHEQIDFDPALIRTKVLGFSKNDFDESLNIRDAEVVVCVGNAIKNSDALGRYRELAELLGGKLGCTRPVFDRGILPFPLVIGQSGVVVKPKLYIAFGVSGAVNHVVGFTDSDKIVAVNKDADAPIFKYCDYGIVGDMDEVCDALLAELKCKGKS